QPTGFAAIFKSVLISRACEPGPGSLRLWVRYDMVAINPQYRKFAMSRRRQVYEGKAKVLFEGPEPGTLVQYFKDDASAFNNQKKGIITGKGVLNNRISEFLMTRLAEIGIPTHFMRRLNMREQLVREVEIIPIAVVTRNEIGR